MANDNTDSGAAVILAFLLGGLTGAAVALLYAPQRGDETRELLAGRVRDGVERGKRIRENAVVRGREIVDEAAQYVDRKKGSLERQKERLAAAVDAGREALREEKGEA